MFSSAVSLPSTFIYAVENSSNHPPKDNTGLWIIGPYSHDRLGGSPATPLKLTEFDQIYGGSFLRGYLNPPFLCYIIQPNRTQRVMVTGFPGNILSSGCHGFILFHTSCTITLIWIFRRSETTMQTV